MLATIVVLALTAAQGSAPVPPAVPLRISITPRVGLAVDVVIENLSATDLDLPVSASFFLDREGESFWAPLDPMTGTPYQGAVQESPGKPVPPRLKPPRLKLAAHQSRRITINLKQLNWAKRISSVWPKHSLDVVVAPGQYALVLEVVSEDQNAAVRSNRASVEVIRERAEPSKPAAAPTAARSSRADAWNVNRGSCRSLD